MKKIGSILLVAVVALFALAVLKNSIAQGAVQGVFKQVTGLDLKIGSLNLGLMAGKLDARSIELKNPAGFADPIMMDMPALLVDLVPASLFKGAPHLEEVQIDLKEFVIVKNKDGKLNLDYLKPAGSKDASGKTSKPAKAPQIQIDQLRLKIGKVIYKDYSKVGSPSVQEFDLGLDETYRNVSNVNAILPLIMTKVLYNTTIGKLVNFDLKGLTSQLDLSGVNFEQLGLGKFKDLGSATAKQAQEALSGATKDLSKTADEAVKGVADLFGSLTKKTAQ